MIRRRITQTLISLSAATLAVVHISYPEIKIDAITSLLFAISILPWLGSLFKSVEITGVGKVEYAEMQKVKNEAEAAGMLNKTKNSIINRKKYTFETFATTDPHIALSGLRIEIESLLNAIALHHNLNIKENKSIRNLINLLCQKQIISYQERSVIDDIIPILNRASHGAEIDRNTLDLVLDIGIKILHSLEEKRSEDILLPPLLKRWLNRDGAEFHEAGSELSKIFVESPEAFLKAMSNNTKSFHEWVESMDTHTFTMYEAENDLENTLLEAYYEKLKALMQKAAEDVVDSQYKTMANAILDKLSCLKIRRIF